MVFGRRTAARRGVAQTVARTALIAGTATAASNAVAGRAQQAAPVAQPAAAPVATVAESVVAESGITLSLIEQLEKLGSLHTAGVITDEEIGRAHV